MANDTSVEVVQTNISVSLDEDKNVVEFRYYGLNEQKLALLTIKVDDLEDVIDQAVANLEGDIGSLVPQIAALEAADTAIQNDLAAETAARIAADLAIANDLTALDNYLTPLVEGEPALRDAAIAVETAARIAAVNAAIAAAEADDAALTATINGVANQIIALEADQVALEATVTALDASFDALETLVNSFAADIAQVEAAITNETAARIAADVLLSHTYFPSGWS
jgi:chromosome segregation ATPase